MSKGIVLQFFLLASLGMAQAPDRAIVDRTIQELADITGFRVRHPVSFQVLSRAQVKRFLNDRIQEAVKPDEIRAEELTLKKFGFVPADFDLRATTIALLTEQTAAFYDYSKKRLFLTDWTSSRLREAATVHELAHALADQNYSLKRFAQRAEHDNEEAAARQAVVEGQANWLMRDVLSAHPEPAAMVDAEPDSLIFDKAPLYLRETLTFPYNAGQAFQQAVYAKFGKDAFRRVFEQPPLSTQQVLHPEMYFAQIAPVQVNLPRLNKELPRMHQLVRGPLGELEHSILLRQFTTEAEAAEVSPHFRGAMYELWEQRKTNRVSLVYRSAWQTDTWAARFFEDYKQVLRHKWKRIQVIQDTAFQFRGESEDGYFTVELSRKEVTSREGLSSYPS